MEGVIIYNDVLKCFQIYACDDVFHLLQAGDQLEVLVMGQWVQTIVEYHTEDEIFGWWFAGIGPCAPLIGHTARIA